MSKYSRDNSIYGEHLLPLVLLAKPPENPMQHIEDLKSDLEFAEAANTPTNLAFVPSSQETIRKVLADLEELQRLRHAPDQSAQLAAARRDQCRIELKYDSCVEECVALRAQLKDQRGINDLAEAECRRIREQLAAAMAAMAAMTDPTTLHAMALRYCTPEQLAHLGGENRTAELNELTTLRQELDLMQTRVIEREERLEQMSVAWGATKKERDELIKQRNEVAGLYYQAKEGEIPELVRERDTLLVDRDQLKQDMEELHRTWQSEKDAHGAAYGAAVKERDELRGLLQDISDYREGKGRFNYSGQPEHQRANDAHDAWESIYTRIRTILAERDNWRVSSVCRESVTERDRLKGELDELRALLGEAADEVQQLRSENEWRVNSGPANEAWIAALDSLLTRIRAKLGDGGP